MRHPPCHGPTTFVDTRRNWPRWGENPAWLVLAPQPWRRCLRRNPCLADRVRDSHRPGRRRLRRQPWRRRVATRLGPRFSMQHERKMAGTAREIKKKVGHERESFEIRLSPPGSGSSALSRSWRRGGRCSCVRSTVRDAGEIERAVAAFASGLNGSLGVDGETRWQTFPVRSDHRACSWNTSCRRSTLVAASSLMVV